MAEEKTALLERLISGMTINPDTGCWLWSGKTGHHGHGIISIGGKHRKAHRVFWELLHGPLPTEQYVCHACGNSGCINPRHLYAGTPASNGLDMVAHGRSLKGSRNHQAKLTEDQVRRIRHDNRTTVAIAKDYGVSDVLIGKIRRRDVWGHIQ